MKEEEKARPGRARSCGAGGTALGSWRGTIPREGAGGWRRRRRAEAGEAGAAVGRRWMEEGWRDGGMDGRRRGFRVRGGGGRGEGLRRA